MTLNFSRLATLAALAGVAIGEAGCAATHYKSTTHDPVSGITVTRELKASALLVKRDLGKVVLGPDSLDGSKSDQMAAASEALTLAAAALRK